MSHVLHKGIFFNIYVYKSHLTISFEILLFFLFSSGQAGRDDKRKGISLANEFKKLTKSSKQYRGFITPPLQTSPEGLQSKDDKATCHLTFSDAME